MNKIIVLLLLISTSGFGQKRTDIEQILQKQTDEWNRGNIEGFMQTYWHSDSLMFIGSKGLTYGWSNTLANYKKGYPDIAAMGKLHFDIKKIDFFDKKTCFVVGKWHLTRPEKGDLEGHFSLILKKIDKKWLIVADHSS